MLGAGGWYSWRRCDFEWGTCAAKRSSTLSSGAGGAAVPTPAPPGPYTCANNGLYLRQKIGGCGDADSTFCIVRKRLIVRRIGMLVRSAGRVALVQVNDSQLFIV